MDKFDKHFKKQYDQQLKPVNPKKAWESFDAKYPAPQKNKKFFLWIGLCFLFTVVVTTLLLYNGDTLNVITEDNLAINKTSNSKQSDSNSSPKPILGRKNSVEAEGQIPPMVFSSSIKVEETVSIANSHVPDAKADTIDKYVKENYRTSENLDLGESKYLRFTDNKSDRSLAVEASVTPKTRTTLVHTFIESPEISQITSIDKKTDISSVFTISNNRTIGFDKKEERLAYGIYAGTNSLNHRFINQSGGVNLGLVLQANLTNYMSIRALAGYSLIKLETRVNSKDLRIDGLNINTRRLEVTSINRSVHQLNSGIELAINTFSSKNYNIDLSAGAFVKIDVSASNTYQIFEDNIEREIEKLNASDYYYPMFFRLSSGIYYSLANTKIVLRPYYMHNLFASEINHPYEWGINTEFLF